jgi:hypothetical protein
MIGARRLTTAVAERQNPLDGFVDGVVAWENIFGTKTETAFRVCGGLALLLYPSDVAERKDAFARFKRLYDRRSRLVHGEAEPPHAELGALHIEACSIAIRAMRALYDRPDLLSVATSELRANAVFGL